ncbi:MAG: hypothetical protein JAY63_20615 [Candidatus Thiodiazotropha taylori]|nr:hypothetical protein [Candidatus Thiodiazotropha taylori]
MEYTPDQLNFIIGPTETNDDAAISAVIEDLEWMEGRKATSEEVDWIATEVRRILAARDDTLVHGDRLQGNYIAADLIRRFVKK